IDESNSYGRISGSKEIKGSVVNTLGTGFEPFAGVGELVGKDGNIACPAVGRAGYRTNPIQKRSAKMNLLVQATGPGIITFLGLDIP
ncbi:MAG: hypothetical protein V2I56_15045, partial [Desulfobacteraceae bacterium]|nr:hypothetical protein [Desulfobacteraceae bacterium]